jgi:hypothetical protein
MPTADRVQPLEIEGFVPIAPALASSADEPDGDLGELWRDLGGGD